MKNPALRFELQMNESTARVFKELVEDLGAESMAEVFRRALSTFKALRDQQKNGGKVFIRAKNGKEQQLISL